MFYTLTREQGVWEATAIKLPALRLLHSGLLLIGAMLVLELAFMALLTWQLKLADRQLWAQLRTYHCAASGNSVIQHFYKASMELIAYGLVRSPAAKEKYEHSVSYMRREGELTWMLMKTHPQSSTELLDESYILSKKAMNVLDDVKRTFDRSAGSVSVLDVRRIMAQVKDTLHAYFEVLADVAAKQDVTRQARQRNEFAFRQGIRVLIMGGFALNAVLSLAAVAFWIRGVTNKVDILVDDARRIGRGEELLPLQGGNDELADLERILHEVNARLRQSDQEKKEFIALISHELRSPLTAISGTLTLAQEGVFGQIDGEDGKRLRDAALSAKHLLSLINDLLDVHKMEAGKSILKLTTCDIAEVIEVAVAETEELARAKNITLTYDCPSLSMYIDADRIGQVFVKLIVNSIERSPAETNISIEAKSLQESLVVEILDDGPAIAEGTSIFDRPEVPAKSDVGTGLIVCKGIVAQHGGTLEARTVADSGRTCFRLCLPLKAAVQQC